MANSCKPGPLNPPPGPWRIPARTPGPLGWMDQGDPMLTTLLGDTPGSLGVRDWADPTLNTGAISGLACVDGQPLALAVGSTGEAARQPAVKDPKVWGPWKPPADYAVLYAMLSANDGEGYYDYMYLDTQNLVTVGIGTCLRSADAARQLRFYQRETLLAATGEEIGKAYDAVMAAKPDKAKKEKPFPATHYETASTLIMTPTDIGERWLTDVKEFQRQLPTYFKGFATYPSEARQAITDIAYQYGASGAANTAAGGEIKTAAEDADWATAGTLCAKLTYASASRNANRKKLFDAAAAAHPKPAASAKK